MESIRIMKSLIRGGVILSIISLFVVFFYAQTETEYAADLANDSLEQFNNNDNTSTETNITKTADQKSDNKKAEIKEQKLEQKDEKAQDTKKTEAASTADQKDEGKQLVTKTGSAARRGAVSRGRFVATAYCLRGRTASGAMVRTGIIAADPRVVRLGMKVMLGAGAYSGDYVVADTGGKIKGNRVDIWMASCAEARRFGRRTVTLSTLN
ncbi:MAG: 3D domain-containing protein [Blastocatellia bacterium]|nr:3D domain-containing protein [Blastocatellia bacterium]